jgi:hypothetical protein
LAVAEDHITWVSLAIAALIFKEVSIDFAEILHAALDLMKGFVEFLSL